jgi:hypothetical protein
MEDGTYDDDHDDIPEHRDPDEIEQFELRRGTFVAHLDG